MEVSAAIPLCVLLGLASAGAWTDLRTRLLPNWLVALTFSAGLAFAFWTGSLDAMPDHLLHFAAALVIGIALFAFKVWGAGDGKFYAAVSVWFPIGDFLQLILAISAVGLILVVIYALRRWGKIFAKDAPGIPYGVAIGLGAALAMAGGML